ncbi:MAG: PKD domain-containing protein, partial [Calditrichaeota bacterium]
NGHGTHCAGNVGALNNNGYACAAASGGWGSGSLVADGNGVKVMPLRIGYSGRYLIYEAGYVRMDFAASAFYYAANNGAKITSCSWGSSNSGGLADAINYFLASGGLIFKAAGNNNNETSDYMTNRTDIISVAATDANDVKASFSTYGTWVDISAPGDAIYSLYHNHSDAQNDYIASLSGTSMATPIAASVAALIWSHNPSWTAEQVKQQLFSTADNIYGISGNSSYIGKLGAGRVNAFSAVNTGGGPAAPVAAFTASATSGCVPMTVNFTDMSTGDVTSWSWTFGDGGASTDENPSHTYQTVGTFTVSLTVTGPGGSDAETKNNYIIVSASPTADFSGTPTNGDAPLQVSFTDLSTGNPTSWSWDFGDGGTANIQNPVHTYSAADEYTVVLTVNNSCGSSVETKVNYIMVSEPVCYPPIAAFVGTPTTGNAPLTVNFTDQSTNNPTSWNWNFGDGGTATVKNPAHVFSAAGVYTITLTATNSCGSDDEVKVNYITVNTAPQNAVHISEIVVTKETYSKFNRGRARVKVVDQSGNATASVTVNGTWSGGATNSSSFTTGSDGWGEATTGWSKTKSDYTFCVTNLTKSGYTFDTNANVVTCGSSNGTSWQVLSNVSPEDLKYFAEELGQNPVDISPNPFNPTTQINVMLTEPSRIKLEIYNVLGKRIITLADEPLEAGMHMLKWDARDEFSRAVGTGTYFYLLIVNEQKYVGKLLYVK